jgi:hypothetical protein
MHFDAVLLLGDRRRVGPLAWDQTCRRERIEHRQDAPDRRRGSGVAEIANTYSLPDAMSGT